MHEVTAVFCPIPDRVSEFARTHPRCVALVHRGQQLYFGELDRRADQFAGYLIAKCGVEPGDTVAIAMNRSFAWIIAALGIMRAGAAYVPLDLAWPDSRLCFAIKNSRATVVVGCECLLDRLKIDTHRVDPCVDANAIAEGFQVIQRPIQPQSLAYVIYTSGSTGAPKGVEITHANLAHLADWHRDAFGVTSRDRASHCAGLGFDAAVWEIWPNLCAGASLYLADDEVRFSPESIKQWIVRERISVAFVPTVHAASIMAMTWPTNSSLRFLLTGGDTLREPPPNGLPFDVVNNYGPTECTVVATSAILRGGVATTPPIGRPIDGARIYLLNEDRNEVPDGSVGEIFIGGNGVGCGYRDLPILTEENFLPDPFASTPGARMYRTGDHGIRRQDGEIEFRGRIDRQIKIHGQRIELDEIGNILAQHSCIEFAVATCNLLEKGEKQLIAHVLLKENAHVPSVGELQRHLRLSLPDYMVPAVFSRLKALPLSQNMKIDLAGLAQSTDFNILEMLPAKEPSTPIERELLSIVQQLLESDSVSIDANFFLAGGHSLLGMQLLMRIRAAFKVDLTLQQLFDAPTVEQLALLITARQHEAGLTLIWEDLLGRKHIGLDENFFDLGGHPAMISVLQDRIVQEFEHAIPIYQLFQNPTIRLQAELTLTKAKPERALPPGVFSLRSSGIHPAIFWVHYLNVNLLKEFGEDQPIVLVTLTKTDIGSLGKEPSLRMIAERIVDKILATQSKGPFNIGGLCIGSVLAYEVARQLREAGHEVSLLVLLDAPSPSYLKSYNSITAKLMRPRYRLERMIRLGLRQTLFNFRKRLIKYSAGSTRSKVAWNEIAEAHDLIEAAAFDYQPERYEGRVLLLLATERIPHGEFLPGWQAIVSENLCTTFVDGYHRELMTSQNVRGIAKVILSHLASALERNRTAPI